MSEEKKIKKNKDPTETMDFDVIISEVDEDTTLLTSVEELGKKWILQAMNRYDTNNGLYSVHLNDIGGQTPTLDVATVNELARNPQNDLKKILAINDLVREYINKDDIIGKVVESIKANVNTGYRLEYDIEHNKNVVRKHKEAQSLIRRVNSSIKLKNLIRKAVVTTYTEGTWVAYLRHDKESYVLDLYPLGVCEIADYEYNGEPGVLFNINELRSRLQKTYKKDRKNKALYFEKIEAEVKANYPPEVYKAFKDREAYAKLDVKYTGVIRINEQNRKYGLTSIFRAFKALIMLEAFDSSDLINAKARGKKFIHQKLRKEVLGNEGSRPGFEEMSFAHANFMGAWQQPTVVVTTPPSVEEITYVEPKVEMINKDKYNAYRSRVLTTLGISFLMDSDTQSVSAANISLGQLLRTINMIAEQLEAVLEKWYRQILIDNKMEEEFTPRVTVLDSEQLEANMKREIASFLFNTLGASYETSYAILGMSASDEAQKRRNESEKDYDNVFKPHPTAYTRSAKDNIDNNKGGNPRDSTDPNKEDYDESYNETRD